MTALAEYVITVSACFTAMFFFNIARDADKRRSAKHRAYIEELEQAIKGDSNNG